jgi:hypothetical protein
MQFHDDANWPRRRFLASGASLLGCALATVAAGLLSGCGDDKGTMTAVEKGPDLNKAKDSMDFYKNKAAAPKKK